MSDFKRYLENLERENAELKNEIALLKMQVQSANDKAKKNEQTANGQEFGVPDLRLSHYADLVQSPQSLATALFKRQSTSPYSIAKNSNSPAPALFKSPSTVAKNSV